MAAQTPPDERGGNRYAAPTVHCATLLLYQSSSWSDHFSIIAQGQMKFQIPQKLLLGEGLHPLRLSSPGIGERLG
jgi:hypothetical protein